MFFIANYNIIINVILGLLVCYFFFSIYEGKNKLNLKGLNEMNNKMSYSSDEKMFLNYAKLPIIRNNIPKKDSFEYKKTQDFLISSKIQAYRSVEIFYGAKAYYLISGVFIGAIIGIIPIAFNFINKKMNLGLAIINFPILLSFALPLLGLLFWAYPNSQISSENKRKKKVLQKEILSLGIVVHSMLETGNNPYQILEVVKEIKPEFKEDIEKTLNEYYINTSQALTNLKKRINIIDFDMIADSLLYAHESDNEYATKFLDDYLTRLEQAQKIIFQKSSRIRPYFLLAASTLPMVGSLLVWFYPWLAEATAMLSSGFGV